MIQMENVGTLKTVCSKCGGERIYKQYKILSRTIEVLSVPCPCEKERIEKVEQEERKYEEAIRLAEQERYIEKLKSRSMLDEKFKNSTFENWNGDNKTQKVINICKKYCDNFDYNKENNVGILLYGNAGVGKTYSVSCIANFLMEQRKSVICTSINGLLRQFKSTYNSSSKESEKDVLEYIKTIDLLIIDDLGTEQLTEWSSSILYEIIDTRYRSDKPLIITTNLQRQEFQNRYHQRINDRIFEMCVLVNCSGNSIREMFSKNKTEILRDEIIN